MVVLFFFHLDKNVFFYYTLAALGALRVRFGLATHPFFTSEVTHHVTDLVTDHPVSHAPHVRFHHRL